jgi:hypothetical protein
MSFKIYFAEQLTKHQFMQYQDVVKLCYQASFGAEHLLSDLKKAQAYLEGEFSSIQPTDEPLFEYISDEICRVNLGAWKKRNLPIDELFMAFCNSAFIRDDAKDTFFTYLQIAERVMKDLKKDFSIKQWREFINSYLECGIRAVHHSAEYRDAEKPSYRIIKVDQIKENWL